MSFETVITFICVLGLVFSGIANLLNNILYFYDKDSYSELSEIRHLTNMIWWIVILIAITR